MPINPLGFNNKSHNNGNNKEVSKKYLLYQNEGDSLVLSNKKHSKQTLINKFKNKFFKKQGCEISFGNSTNNAKEPKTEAQIALSKYGLDFENYPDLELQFESEIHDLMKIAEQNNIEYSVIAQVGQIINEDNTMHLLDFVPKMAIVAVEVSNGTGFNIEDCAYLVKEYRDDLDAMQKPIRLMSEYKISGKDSTQISTNFRLRDHKADEAAMLVRDSKISGDDAGEIILNVQDEAEKEEIIKFIKDNEVSAQCAIELKEKFIDDNEKYITDAAKVTKEGFASVDTVLSLFKEFGDDIEKIKFAVGVINLNACDIESAVNATHLHFNEGYEEKDAYQVAKYFKSRDKKLSQVERLQKEYEAPAGICAQAISLSEENEIEPEKLIDVLIAIEKHPHRLPMALDMLKENAEPKDVAKIMSAVYENEIQLFNCKNILQKYELSANEALFFTRKFEKELECNPEAANRQIENIVKFAKKHNLSNYTASRISDKTYRFQGNPYEEFDIEKIAKITSEFKDKNIIDDIKKEVRNPSLNKYIEEIFSDEDLYGEHIIEFSKQNLGYEDVKNGFVKIARSSLKNALKKPNLYLSNIPQEYSGRIDGKYPQLSDDMLRSYQNRVADFFNSNLSGCIKAMKYLDADTFNQLMDKRFTLFEEKLQAISNMDEASLEMYSELIKCSNEKGKPLTAKDKIQLLEIVDLSDKTGYDLNFFRKNIEVGKINLQEIKNNILHDVVKSLGFDNEDIKKIPTRNLEFDNDYSFLLMVIKDDKKFYANEIEKEAKRILTKTDTNLKTDLALYEYELKKLVKESNNTQRIELLRKIIKLHKDILENKITREQAYKPYSDFHYEYLTLDDKLNTKPLKDAVIAGIKGDFNGYIHNINNPYGKANHLTQKEFEKYGLSYENWLKPQIQPKEVLINKRKYSVDLWDRKPQKDLFLGNKTNCCTGIVTGTNFTAVPLYLLNTMFNVIELNDENGKTTAMVRCLMTEIDGKPALMLDNFEVNKTFIKNISKDELIEMRNTIYEWALEYAKSVSGDDDVEVYSHFTNETSVPNDELISVEEKTRPIGHISSEKVYLDYAQCDWVNPSKINDYEYSFYKIPEDFKYIREFDKSLVP